MQHTPGPSGFSGFVQSPEKKSSPDLALPGAGDGWVELCLRGGDGSRSNAQAGVEVGAKAYRGGRAIPRPSMGRLGLRLHGRGEAMCRSSLRVGRAMALFRPGTTRVGEGDWEALPRCGSQDVQGRRLTGAWRSASSSERTAMALLLPARRGAAEWDCNREPERRFTRVRARRGSERSGSKVRYPAGALPWSGKACVAPV